jgi:hypothetical protein
MLVRGESFSAALALSPVVGLRVQSVRCWFAERGAHQAVFMKFMNGIVLGLSRCFVLKWIHGSVTLLRLYISCVLETPPCLWLFDDSYWCFFFHVHVTWLRSSSSWNSRIIQPSCCDQQWIEWNCDKSTTIPSCFCWPIRQTVSFQFRIVIFSVLTTGYRLWMWKIEKRNWRVERRHSGH